MRPVARAGPRCAGGLSRPSGGRQGRQGCGRWRVPVLDALAGFPGALAVGKGGRGAAGGACFGPLFFVLYPAYMGEAYI